MKIQILGTGCPKCQKLTETVKAAVAASGQSCTVEKVTDMQEIVSFGVMATPALVVDGKVVMAGKLPALDEVKALLAAQD